MGQYTWDTDGLADLRALKRSGKPWNVIATQLGRSVASCKARYAVLAGKRNSNGPPPNREPLTRPDAAYEVPAFRRNDDAKPLRLMLAAMQQARAA